MCACVASGLDGVRRLGCEPLQAGRTHTGWASRHINSPMKASHSQGTPRTCVERPGPQSAGRAANACGSSGFARPRYLHLRIESESRLRFHLWLALCASTRRRRSLLACCARLNISTTKCRCGPYATPLPSLAQRCRHGAEQRQGGPGRVPSARARPGSNATGARGGT